MQLAESGSFFLQVDLFKVRGKFALSDAYEDHFLIRKGKVLMVTHRRVLLLQVNIIIFYVINPFLLACYSHHTEAIHTALKLFTVSHHTDALSFGLQQPFNTISQKKFNPARDPCSVLWDVLWDDLVTMELAFGKKDHPKAPHSQLILYLRDRSTEMREQTRVIKCIRDRPQAFEVYTSIERAMSIYGPHKTKVRS